jgi:ATP-dependent Lhr-like helicase
MPAAVSPTRAKAWFQAQGWQPHGFQREVWAAMAAGESGLLHATTGAGKTYAVGFGAMARAPASKSRHAPPLGVLWLTPMRALAADTLRALQRPLAELAPTWTCGLRTGDTPSAERARQDRRWPTLLVTTPESLSLMLAREHAAAELAGVHTVIVDEWHELVASKRGVQVQLALARLKRLRPDMVVWGLSATLGNLDEALATLTGGAPGRLVRGLLPKDLVIDTLLPDEPGRFTWGGHLGAQMQPAVVREIAQQSGTTLVFTNVRSQAEIWYQLLLDARPDWAGLVALHHGSLDRSVREWVEAGLKAGSLKAVVATSSLDLGVDFLPVERVLQIGSPKGIARLLQRAGRSGHAPGRPSRITLVPTHTLELVEAAALREAALAGQVESRQSPEAPLDVLVQHLVTLALGGGFEADPLADGRHGAQAVYDEVRSAWAYRALSREAFDWALAFVERGGNSLGAYPEYHRVAVVDGRWRVPDAGIARRHKLQIGTIVGDAVMKVAWQSGGTLGTIEESFIARLKKGDCFVFAGRVLEYVRTVEMTAQVRKASKPRGTVAVWSGSRMAMSEALGQAVQAQLQRAAAGQFDAPELRAAEPMLRAQARLSRLPGPGSVLVERYRSREGHHLFIYPFAGRHVHLGLAGLLAWRLAQAQPNTFSLAVNDHGFELLSAEPVDLAALDDGHLLRDEDLLADVLASLNARELAQRRFREIARVAGLVFSGYPGASKALRQVQASAQLFYEVFRQYDGDNRLLAQADAEVLAQELELGRLRSALKALRAARLEQVRLTAPSPFALPLMVDRLRERLSTEQLADRLQRMLAEAHQALDEEPLPAAPRAGVRRRRRPAA